MDESQGFDLDQGVKLTMSNETGVVIGKAQYVAGENSYLVRYMAADGRQVEAWWNESALVRG